MSSQSQAMEDPATKRLVYEMALLTNKVDATERQVRHLLVVLTALQRKVEEMEGARFGMACQVEGMKSHTGRFEQSVNHRLFSDHDKLMARLCVFERETNARVSALECNNKKPE
jgi:hypothetical protein